MPLARISLTEGKSEAYIQAIADGVYEAMRATIDVPEGDRFQIISEHKLGHLIADKTYMGIERSNDVVIIQITMKGGRTPEKKKAFYRRIMQNLTANPGLRKQDIMVVLNENDLIDWSFGNGEAQLG
ncbi:tautomerase family protein [Ktedonosporobacter rubrisoli]|uniref:Tautomerase family protein n=1 Tax=Ktedonosporobacter rubrisoli TaxID=2509675 RepID=A0A4P6JIA2_KTERU|nr:tautomerase family protein [Ktedonosporobacter rubrisoli]QBD74693.1 tautomerase family protein [Ktedonosporobacter rubrisoli]